MRTVIFTFALSLTLTITAAQAAETQKHERVHAEKPTVVTVEDTRSHVAQDQKPRSSFGRKVGRAVLLGSAKAWNGVVDFTGMMLNVDQDVPSKRERREARRQ